MAVATEKIIPGVIPPKEEPVTTLVDFMDILENFNPATIAPDQLWKMADRDPYSTGGGIYVKLGYKDPNQGVYNDGNKVYPIPGVPVLERLGSAQLKQEYDREALEKLVSKYEEEWYAEYNPAAYQKARAALITAIGSKVCFYIVQKEYSALSKEDCKKQIDDYSRWLDYRGKEMKEFGDDEGDGCYEENLYAPWTPYTPLGYTPNTSRNSDKLYIPLFVVKMKMVRKKLSLTQREFAKRIGSNINKYGQLETGKLEDLSLEFFKKVVDATYANPYWLADPREYTEEVDADRTAMTVKEAEAEHDDVYPMFADAKVIRHWWSHIGESVQDLQDLQDLWLAYPEEY